MLFFHVQIMKVTISIYFYSYMFIGIELDFKLSIYANKSFYFEELTKQWRFETSISVLNVFIY